VRQRDRLLICVATLVLVFAAACTQEIKRPEPKFSGRLFVLSGDRTSGADLLEVAAAPDGSTNNYQVVTSGIREAVASQDQKRLLYTIKDEIMLRDFATGGPAKSLVKADSFCLAWAPDANHFSYKVKVGATTKLYASDLEGKTKLVLDDPNGSSYCAQWIAPDRLVFERFVGAATSKTGEQLKPNTTTVATIGDPVKLKDTPRKWSVESVCAKNNVGFVRSADQGRLLIAKNIDHFETVDPSPAPCSECRFTGFAAQSCVPFFIEQPTSTTTELFYLNPANWQKQRPTAITWTFSPNARMLIKSSARLMVVGDIPDKLLLIDAETGDVKPLLEKSATAGIQSPQPVVWIEN